jgi:hypothetical protein
MQRFVMGEKYFTVVPRQQKKKNRIESLGEEKEKEEKRSLTRERRTDFSPADISKVQEHALL